VTTGHEDSQLQGTWINGRDVDYVDFGDLAARADGIWDWGVVVAVFLLGVGADGREQGLLDAALRGWRRRMAGWPGAVVLHHIGEGIWSRQVVRVA